MVSSESPKRQAILNAALELFAERGFYGTTMPEVAERAKVGAGTLYRYFESREQLVNVLFQEWKQAYGTHLMRGLEFTGSVRSICHEIWTRMGQFARRHPQVMAFLELHNHRAYLDGESQALERRILEPIFHFVKVAQSGGALKQGSPEVLMAIVYGAFTGILRTGNEGFLELTDEVFAEAEQCVWEAIRG